ncbi:MAG: class I fructose-bisphosphate aldolase [Verrucomicrobiota bacterium]
MQNSARVQEILSWYGGENVGTLSNLARMMNFGRLAGTGKFVILPVDQGFEHGPARSFASNPPAYDPRYHFQFALDAGCNAYAAPLGFLAAAARDFAHTGLPLILKCNNHDLVGGDEKDPDQAVTASVEDALRLGCAAVGFTIYPGSSHAREMYEEIRTLARQAKNAGLAVVIWSYPRGSALSKEGETALDICGYAAHLAAELGANIVKVKLPTAHLEQEAAKKIYEAEKFPRETIAERVRHVLQCAFDGRRIVIFSGGAAEADDKLLEQVRGIQEGGGFGSIIGRNSFTRPKADALKLLGSIMEIYQAP